MGDLVIFFSKYKWESFSLLERFVFTIFLHIYRVYTYFSLLSYYRAVFTLHLITILGFMLLLFLVLLLAAVYAIQNNKSLDEVSGLLLDRILEILSLVMFVCFLSMQVFSSYLKVRFSYLLVNVRGPQVSCSNLYDYILIIPYCTLFVWVLIAILKVISSRKLVVAECVLLCPLVYNKKLFWLLWALLILFIIFFFFFILPLLVFIGFGPFVLMEVLTHHYVM